MQGHTLRLVALDRLEQNEKPNAFYHFVINATHGVSFSLALPKLLNRISSRNVSCSTYNSLRLYIHVHSGQSGGKLLTNSALLF